MSGSLLRESRLFLKPDPGRCCKELTRGSRYHHNCRAWSGIGRFSGACLPVFPAITVRGRACRACLPCDGDRGEPKAATTITIPYFPGGYTEQPRNKVRAAPKVPCGSACDWHHHGREHFPENVS